MFDDDTNDVYLLPRSHSHHQDTDDTKRDLAEEGSFWKSDGFSYPRDYCSDDKDFGCYE